MFAWGPAPHFRLCAQQIKAFLFPYICMLKYPLGHVNTCLYLSTLRNKVNETKWHPQQTLECPELVRYMSWLPTAFWDIICRAGKSVQMQESFLWERDRVAKVTLYAVSAPSLLTPLLEGKSKVLIRLEEALGVNQTEFLHFWPSEVLRLEEVWILTR